MDLPCPTCAKSVRIPDDQNDQPGRRAMCVHCRKSFTVPDTLLGDSAAPPITSTSATAVPRDALPAAAVAVAAAPAPRAGTTARAGATARLAPLSRPGSATLTDLSRSGIDPLQDLSMSTTVTGTLRAVTRPTGPNAWAICAMHPGELAADVCETCNAGYCAGCARPMPGGKVCPLCQRPTMPAADKRRAFEKERLRGRPYLTELSTIVLYPLRDPLSFAILALLVGFFGAARGVSMGVQAAGFSYIFGQGLLMAYAFTALRRVAHGDLAAGVPDIAGLDDLLRPVRLSAAAFLVAAAPMIGIVIAGGLALASLFTDGRPGPKLSPRVQLRQAVAPVPGMPVATEEGEAGVDPNAALQQLADQAQSVQAGQTPTVEPEPEPAAVGRPATAPTWAPFAITLAILWALGYFPVAFMVAAISQSVLSTLDPREGLRAILAMSWTYWQAVAITTILFLVCGLVRGLAGAHPAVSFVVGPVVESYQWLAVSCALGLAIFKRAEALGFD